MKCIHVFLFHYLYGMLKVLVKSFGGRIYSCFPGLFSDSVVVCPWNLFQDNLKQYLWYVKMWDKRKPRRACAWWYALFLSYYLASKSGISRLFEEIKSIQCVCAAVHYIITRRHILNFSHLFGTEPKWTF